MEIKTYSALDQVDPAADLGVVAPPLPDILTLRQLIESAPAAPPQIIEGILHQGCKLILGGTSKSNKSWSLLDLALSVASGKPWWGRRCTQAPVVYINFELHTWAIVQRLNALCAARPECQGVAETLHLWNLRGHNSDLSLLRPRLQEQLARYQFGLIILDPAYKLLGNRDENANSEIANLMNEFEALVQCSGAALVIAHHFAKGDSSSKDAIDRMSGAGAWARDPDSVLVMTPHEESNCFTVTPILRNLPQMDEFVVRWNYPLMCLAAELNPEALRRHQTKNKCCTDSEFVHAVFGDTGQAIGFSRVIDQASQMLDLSRATSARYLKRLVAAGLIQFSAGLYWRATALPSPEVSRSHIP